MGCADGRVETPGCKCCNWSTRSYLVSGHRPNRSNLDPHGCLSADRDLRTVHLKLPWVPARRAAPHGDSRSRQETEFHQRPGVRTGKIDSFDDGAIAGVESGQGSGLRVPPLFFCCYSLATLNPSHHCLLMMGDTFRRCKNFLQNGRAVGGSANRPPLAMFLLRPIFPFDLKS